MAPISGTYRLVNSDNKLAETQATFSDYMSPADMQLVAAPDNLWTIVIKEKEKGIIFDVTYSKTPQFDGSYEYNYGEVTTFPGCSGSTVLIKSGPNTITETWSGEEGTVARTYTLNFDSFGTVIQTATPGVGVVATSLYERVNLPDFCGFYLLESHENVGAIMDQLTKEQVDLMLEHCAFRVTKSGDVYTATDYFGVGFPVKTTSFRLGEQQEVGALEEIQMKEAVLLVTRMGPTKISYLLKDRATGKVQNWIGEVTADNFVWNVEAANGVTTRMTYRRVGDIMGTWKLVAVDSNESYLDALGVPKGPIREQMLAERPTMKFSHLGAGVWDYRSDQKVAAHEPIMGRMGEEWTLNIAGLGTMTMVYNFTKTGLIGVKKMAGKIIASKFTILKDFAIEEDHVVGIPGATVSVILARV